MPLPSLAEGAFLVEVRPVRFGALHLLNKDVPEALLLKEVHEGRVLVRPDAPVDDGACACTVRRVVLGHETDGSLRPEVLRYPADNAPRPSQAARQHQVAD